VPGFIDAHSHPSYAGIRHLRWVDCNLRSLAAIQDAIRARAANTPPGDWVVGSMYDDTKTSEGRKLTREDLDAAAPNHPVFIEHRGGHTAYVNSLAYRRTEITDQIADPPGGKFDRDPATGKLSGGLRENATDPFQKILHANFTRDEMRQGVKLMFQMMVRTGVTSVTDAQASPADLLATRMRARRGSCLCVCTA
jgi:predicted amidohydrolase YtcJ